MVRLKEIAEHVGVSITTVSRVIKNDPSRNVNPDTKKKIWKAVKELGYTPNEYARQLVSSSAQEKKRTKRIAWLASPRLAETNPYFSKIYSGISETLNDAGYTLLLISNEDLEDDALFHQIIREKEVDGVLLIDKVDPKKLLEIKELIPVVGVDFNYSDHAIATVDYDREEAAYQAVEHLITKGHRKIGFIGGGIGIEMKKEKRFKGYKKAMNDFKLTIEERCIINSDWCMERSYLAAKELLGETKTNRPTAIFCAGDLLAIAAMRAAHELELHIPSDIAFIGIDNNEMAQYIVPALSTVSVPQYEMGVIAAKTLMSQIEDNPKLALKTLLPFELLVRQST
ncbi:LacI family DNA-binding transcriptional regulator [Viridibacillus sp. NPDC096237]|uniref:LacI family DNA-binding transcriptional regulator n=1 Tax=Viridibacillus sp. NPDC096237 TaxID=3390721 RepID=UPI003D08CA5B